MCNPANSNMPTHSNRWGVFHDLECVDTSRGLAVLYLSIPTTPPSANKRARMENKRRLLDAMIIGRSFMGQGLGLRFHLPQHTEWYIPHPS